MVISTGRAMKFRNRKTTFDSSFDFEYSNEHKTRQQETTPSINYCFDVVFLFHSFLILSVHEQGQV